MARAFETASKQGSLIFTSELTVAECCYKPAREKNALLLSVYEHLFEKSGDVRLVPLTGAVAKNAALIGAGLGEAAGCHPLRLGHRGALRSPAHRRQPLQVGPGLTVVRV